jgi:hypothetical protein
MEEGAGQVKKVTSPGTHRGSKAAVASAVASSRRAWLAEQPRSSNQVLLALCSKWLTMRSTVAASMISRFGVFQNVCSLSCTDRPQRKGMCTTLQEFFGF